MSVSSQFVLESKLKLRVCLTQQKSEADVGQKNKNYLLSLIYLTCRPMAVFFEASIHQKSNRFL